MSTRAAVLVVLCCVVLAGCSAPISLPSADGTDVRTASEGTTLETITSPAGGTNDERDASGRRAPRATSEAAATAVAVDNPYGEETLTVAIDATNVSAGRDVRSVVREALDYWEQNATRYAGYPIEYRLLEAGSDTTDADVVVRFVPDIRDCGREQHVAGCAPYVTRGPVDRPAIVRIQTGYDDDSTVLVLEHEFGHTLGLDHDDAPSEVMAGRTILTTQPMTNASDRELAWNDSTLSVYVDDAMVDPADREAVDRQITVALDYFDDGAAGTVPENVSFVRVDDPDRADIVIRFAEASPCGASPGSCGRVGGFDPDGDGALETYTKLEITLAGIDTDAVAWHVARWVGLGLSLDEEEYPEPLRTSTSYGERRSEWWL